MGGEARRARRPSSRRESGGSGLYAPSPVRVRRTGRVPASVEGRRVEAVREEWLVEDRWWSSEPLRRHYVELVLEGGRCVVVFCDLLSGRWFEQR